MTPSIRSVRIQICRSRSLPPTPPTNFSRPLPADASEGVWYRRPVVTSFAAPLTAALAELDPVGAAWVGEQVEVCADPLRLRVAFARAARKLSEPGALDLGRTALVVGALERADEPALVEQLYRAGELGEQCSVLRMLARLPGPERFTGLAIEACRTNVRSVFEAIACANPFAAAHFPQPAFNQLVLKTLFLGLPAGAIVGLADRSSAELRRMVEGFASERRAAGRDISSDVDLVLATCPSGDST